MKHLLAAFALIAALPAAAAAQSAPVDHTQHAGGHAEHGSDHAGHEGGDCCDHKTPDGKPMECCAPDADGKRPACCEGKHGDDTAKS